MDALTVSIQDRLASEPASTDYLDRLISRLDPLSRRIAQRLAVLYSAEYDDTLQVLRMHQVEIALRKPGLSDDFLMRRAAWLTRNVLAKALRHPCEELSDDLAGDDDMPDLDRQALIGLVNDLVAVLGPVEREIVDVIGDHYDDVMQASRADRRVRSQLSITRLAGWCSVTRPAGITGDSWEWQVRLGVRKLKKQLAPVLGECPLMPARKRASQVTDDEIADLLRAVRRMRLDEAVPRVREFMEARGAA